MKFNLFAYLMFGSLFIAGTHAMAYTVSIAGSASEGGGGGVRTALDECAGSVDQDANGRPDRSKMDACMTAKGFKKPEGGPPRGPAGANSNGDEPPPGPPPSSH